MGVATAGESPRISGEFVGETYRVLKCTQTYRLGNQNQKGPICLWVAEEVTESQYRAEQAALFPLVPLSHIQRQGTGERVAPPWRIPKTLLLTM